MFFNFSFFSITGRGIGLDYHDTEWFALETLGIEKRRLRRGFWRSLTLGGCAELQEMIESLLGGEKITCRSSEDRNCNI